MKVIGLTGGIGSGKSTVAELFEKLNVSVIDADVLARLLVNHDQPAYQLILAKFGKQILSSNQQLDRQKLRTIIFSDPLAKEWLEKLLHPLINDEIKKRLRAIKTGYAIVVIPLLFETGPYDYLDRILVVDCPEALQICRVKKRDTSSEQHIKKIILTQVDRQTRLQGADDVIYNDGDLASLETQVKKLHQQYINLI
jgi:dephospho-CoA kinase